MSSDFHVSNAVKDLIAKITLESGFKISSDVKYSDGSQPGDGYATNTLAAKIVDGEKSLDIFLKCALDFSENSPEMDTIYVREIFFYKTIYPTYQKFLNDKGVKDGFSSVPKSYGFYEKQFKSIIALENLRTKGFTLFDKTKYMNHEHLALILRTFAKFHAISFAMKDQNKECHDQFCDECPNIFQVCKSRDFEKITARIVAQFLSKLDPDEDRDITERCHDLCPKIEDHNLNLSDYLSEYSILTKGDCWINNMMILYETVDEEYPKDLVLIDWQGITRASPVHDLAPLFYSVTSEETMDNYSHYLKLYHDELSRRIRELGSNPDILYPYSIFEREWRHYAPYSFGRAVACIKVILRQKDEVPNLQNAVNNNGVGNFLTDIQGNEKEWIRRTKYIARHFIDMGAF